MTTSSCQQQIDPAAATTIRPSTKQPTPINKMNNHHNQAMRPRSRPLVGNFEENILNNRLQPDRVVEDYSLEVRTAPYMRSLKSKVRVSFFSAGDSFPYLGQAHIGQRAYKIPKKGTLQVTLFNPNGTLVKLFLLQYDLTDMPPNSQTFLRQKTLLMIRPTSSVTTIDSPMVVVAQRSPKMDDDSQGADQVMRPAEEGKDIAVLRDINSKPPRTLPPSNLTNVSHNHGLALSRRRNIKYIVQLNIVSSKSNRIYLNKDLRIFISKKVDLETATQLAKQDYELKSFDEMPSNPKYFSR